MTPLIETLQDYVEQHINTIDEGIYAHEQGKRRDDNPYLSNTAEHDWWMDGYNYSANRTESLELLTK